MTDMTALQKAQNITSNRFLVELKALHFNTLCLNQFFSQPY